MKGGWYLNPQKTGKENVLDPMSWTVQGKEIRIASLTAPIMIDGQFKGVVGVDYDLAFIQKLAIEVNAGLFQGNGRVTIVSNIGLIVADSAHPELAGSLFAANDGKRNDYVAMIRAGQSEVSSDETTGEW